MKSLIAFLIKHFAPGHKLYDTATQGTYELFTEGVYVKAFQAVYSKSTHHIKRYPNDSPEKQEKRIGKVREAPVAEKKPKKVKAVQAVLI
jgi:hypothetical protein